MRAVTVSIDRLVFDGLPLAAAQVATVQRALEQELAGLFARHGGHTRWHGGAAPAVAAPALRLAGTPQPGSLGCELARSLFATLRSTP